MKVDLVAVGLVGLMLCGVAAAEQKVDPKFDKVQCHAWTGGVGAQSHSYAECNQPLPPPVQTTRVVIEQAPAPQVASPPVQAPKPIRQ